MTDGERAALAVQEKLAVHEARCAEQWKSANGRLARIEYVMFAIVLLLLFGEGTVIETIKRLLNVAAK